MKTIIFDFDGTIADSAAVFRDAWNEYASVYHYDQVEFHHIAETRHMPLQKRAKHFRFPMHKLPIILPKLYRYFRERANEVKIFDGVGEMLEALHTKGYQICILSSNSVENIEAVLQHNNISTIHHVISAGKIFGKDAALKKFMKAQRLSPTDILYIGDEFRDLEACNKVGIPFAWVSWGLDGDSLIRSRNPVYCFDQPADITQALC